MPSRWKRFAVLAEGVSFYWRGERWRKVRPGKTDKPYNAVHIDPVTRRIDHRDWVPDETLVIETAGVPPYTYNVIDLAAWRQQRTRQGA